MDNSSSADAELQDNTTDGADVLTLYEHPLHQVSSNILKIGTPFILLMGSFGNIATVFIMRRIKDHNSSQHAILMALAVSDLTFLISEVTYQWVYTFDVDLRLLHTALCKLLFWAAYVSGVTSAWLITFVTVQRTVAVLWPHRMRAMCTVRRTWIVIAAIVLIAFALNFHLLIGMDISKQNWCQTIPGVYRSFFANVFLWVYLCIGSGIPSVCLFVCDIILSVTLFKAFSSSSSISTQVNQHDSAGQNIDNRRKTSYRTTVMVWAISSAFLVLTLPNCVYLIRSSFIFKMTGQYPQAIPVADLVFALTQQLWYTNSAINFYLYCLTGTKFRREFVSWICCGVKSSSVPSVQETASEASRGGRHKHPRDSPLSK